MKKFEYMATEYNKLNTLGLEGWEAYAVHHYGETTYYLKREVE